VDVPNHSVNDPQPMFIATDLLSGAVPQPSPDRTVSAREP
jgi:hypothetical protein